MSLKKKNVDEEIKEEIELEYGDGYKSDGSEQLSNDFDVIDLKDPEGPLKQVHA